ncbi:RNA polymerase factor sigma-54 [Ammoniphilus resinae]|uniref:RNA polymerase sigma-54 factor n=1 Tax=Ammoniphilus resinae TaxID=861532 RepID=A0ABS4GQS9_9BACL|nr:RNA polymerase factor sigma-54 [Ammoniphilus resinae]MBP1932614.1 RNA polymerase sigma-54 factor [Ammoniphilus resinae]
MQIGYGLHQEQTMKLVMTPELRQAITILQLSALDLLEYLNGELNENPVIEPLDLEFNRQEKKQPEDPLSELQWKESIQDRGYEYPHTITRSGESESNTLDWIARNDISLEKHLLEQLSFLRNLPEIIRILSRFLIGNLDENGYLDIQLEETAKQFNVDPEWLEQALIVVQGLEPRGVGARNLKECLIIQLEYAGKKDSVAFTIVENYLHELAEGKVSKIAAEMQIKPREVQEAVDYIRTLNPRPGAFYHQQQARYIIPDVTVKKVNDHYVILVNESVTPRITISKQYEKMMHLDAETKKYVHNKMNSALWLIKSIEQRRTTIYKVTEAIVQAQIDFFEKGLTYLKPMTLKEIAETVGLHESTISRATNNKYVQTPRGLFELKYFFSSALTTSTGESASSESVKMKLKEFIEKEDRSKPLSDQKLSDMFQQMGITVSRRTVAKYREEINIPSSAKRKRY